jgi:hypothetical protein
LGFSSLGWSLFGIAGKDIGGVSSVLVEFFNSLFNEGSQFGQQIDFLSSGTSAVSIFCVEGIAHVAGIVE